MTEIEEIKKAMEEYDKGNWKLSIEKLKNTRKDASLTQIAEIDTYIGWNKWKMQEKDEAVRFWNDVVSSIAASCTTKASAHAGLGIYYAEKGDKEKALYHAKLAQELLPPDATINQVMNLNACGISLAKIGELERAEKVLLKVAQINEQLEKSDDSGIAKKAEHQRAKNGYNLASLIYIPQKRYEEAIKELHNEVAPRYVKVGAETDLAAAYHRLSEAYELIERPGIYEEKSKLEYALKLEERSSNLWRKHPDDPKRIETAEKNIQRLREKIEKLKQ